MPLKDPRYPVAYGQVDRDNHSSENIQLLVIMTRNSITTQQSPAMAETSTKASSELRIDADLLIPGRGDPIKNATLICGTANASSSDERSKILYVGSTSDVPSKYSSLSATKVPVLMPGLWDAHVHYFGAPD